MSNQEWARAGHESSTELVVCRHHRIRPSRSAEPVRPNLWTELLPVDNRLRERPPPSTMNATTGERDEGYIKGVRYGSDKPDTRGTTEGVTAKGTAPAWGDSGGRQ